MKERKNGSYTQRFIFFLGGGGVSHCDKFFITASTILVYGREKKAGKSTMVIFFTVGSSLMACGSFPERLLGIVGKFSLLSFDVMCMKYVYKCIIIDALRVLRQFQASLLRSILYLRDENFTRNFQKLLDLVQNTSEVVLKGFCERDSKLFNWPSYKNSKGYLSLSTASSLKCLLK